MNIDSSAIPISSNLRAASVEWALAVLTILIRQGTGIVYCHNEDLSKSRLVADAAEIQAQICQHDMTPSKPANAKSWNHMQWAHLHAGGMGTTARMVSALIRPALGAAGGPGYSIFRDGGRIQSAGTVQHGHRQGVTEMARHAIIRRIYPLYDRCYLRGSGMDVREREPSIAALTLFEVHPFGS